MHQILIRRRTGSSENRRRRPLRRDTIRRRTGSSENLSFADKSLNNKSMQYIFCFDKNLNFGSYIQNKIFINGLKLPSSEFNIKQEEFIY